MRLDCAEWYHRILVRPLLTDKPDIKGTIKRMEEIRLTRDDLMDTLNDVLYSPLDIPSKVKTAFTREYNKTVSADIKKRKRFMVDIDEETDEEDVEDEDVKDLDGEMELLNL